MIEGWGSGSDWGLELDSALVPWGLELALDSAQDSAPDSELVPSVSASASASDSALVSDSDLDSATEFDSVSDFPSEPQASPEQLLQYPLLPVCVFVCLAQLRAPEQTNTS